MKPTILLVEDSEDDVFFMRRALNQGGVEHSLQVAMDGQVAIDYLAGKDSYSDRLVYPVPNLILLDLRLPMVPGLEVLRWIKDQAHLACVPVIVLTSSNQEFDMQTAYRLGVNSFLVKPSNATELSELAKALCEYWLRLNAVPRACQAAATQMVGQNSAFSGASPLR